MFKWIKLSSNTFDDEKIQLIMSLPNGDTYIVIWLQLLCLAGKQNADGVFTIGDKPITLEMLAVLLHRPKDVVQEAICVFGDYGMVEYDAVTYSIPNWKKYQSLDSNESYKEKNRIRQAKFREKQKGRSDEGLNDYFSKLRQEKL